MQRSCGEAFVHSDTNHTLPEAGVHTLPIAKHAPHDALHGGVRHSQQLRAAVGESNGKRQRGPKSRYPPVVPVPNVSKKARGRLVPSAKASGVSDGRHFRCIVEGCYKMFSRREHLNRHMASLHTNDRRE